MFLMFNSCQKLKEIKGLEKFNTINVTLMSGMFQNCYEIECLNYLNCYRYGGNV